MEKLGGEAQDRVRNEYEILRRYEKQCLLRYTWKGLEPC